MTPFLIILVGIIFFTIIIWPPIIFLYLIFAIYPIGLIIIHKWGYFVPHWTFGIDPTSEVYLYYRSRKKETLILSYRGKYERKWYTVNEFNGFSKSNPSLYAHYFFINNLTADTKFIYKIQDQTGKDIKHAKGTFFTQGICNQVDLNDQKKSFSFGVFGDFQIGENLEIIETYFIYLLRKHNPELIISLGDNVHKYNDLHAWKVHNTILRKLIRFVPFYTTPGNHDYGQDQGKTLSFEALMLPVSKTNEWYYSFSYQGVFFISLLSQRLFDDNFQQEQIVFLKNALKESELLKKQGKINWIVVYTHVPWWGPPYNEKNAMDKEEIWIKQNWIPIFEKYEVDLFFAGHKHSYCRDTNKIITGSMHGVRKYPEKTEPNYILRNSHQLCIVHVNPQKIRVESKTWFDKNIEVFEIYKKHNL